MSRSNSVPATPFEATITDLSHDGRGVARVDGKALFVSGALLGEQVMVRLRKRHRHFDEAEVVEVITPSPHRVEPRCRHFAECSGCSMQHLDAEAQIAAKQRVLAENFERIGKVAPQQWLPPLTGEPWESSTTNISKASPNFAWRCSKYRLECGGVPCRCMLSA